MGDLRQLGVGPEKRGGVITQRFVQPAFDLPFKSLGVLRRSSDLDVAAGNKCFDLRESERLEEPAQVIHLDGMTADVDRSQESNILCRSIVKRRPIDLVSSH